MAGSFRFEEERRSRGPSTPATVILPKSAATVVMPPRTRSAAAVVLPEDVPTGTRRKTGTPAVTAASVDMSNITEDDIIEESTASGGGGGGGGGYDWLEEESTTSGKPAPVGLILLGLAGLAAWVWR